MALRPCLLSVLVCSATAGTKSHDHLRPHFGMHPFDRVHPKLFARLGKTKEFKRVEVGLAK